MACIRIQEQIKYFVVNLFAWMFLILVCLLFKIYKKIIHLILKIKHGKSFGGILDDSDIVFCLSDVSKLCITVVLIIRSEKQIDLLATLKAVFKNKVFDYPDKFSKLTSSLHINFGYPYWIKHDVTVNDVIRSLILPQNEEFTEECLKKLTGKIINSKYPKNDTAPWDIHVSEKPLKAYDNDSYYRYPVITRFHHSIADGTSLVALLIKILAEESCQNYSAGILNKFIKNIPNSKKKSKSLWSVSKTYLDKAINNILLYLELLFISLGRIACNNQLRPSDINALHGSNYLGVKTAVWTVEVKSECIPLVKAIKNRANSRFTCVLATAISASLTDYFRRKSLRIPDYTSGLLSQLLDFSFVENSSSVNLENKMTGLFFKLHSTHNFKTLMDAFKKITEQMTEDLKYSDALLSGLFLRKICGIIPINLLETHIGMQAQTFLITNVPGGSQIKIGNGCIIEKVIPLAPNLKSIGVSFAFLTYDDRFQIGVLVDKSLKIPQFEVQQIADDILRYIKLMYDELMKIL